jgi:hypothetical protein
MLTCHIKNHPLAPGEKAKQRYMPWKMSYVMIVINKA